MTKSFVALQIKNYIAEITFGTPKSNSMPQRILDELEEAILSAGKNSEVKVILLKSEGEKAFCAGASFDELLEINDIEASKKFFGGFAKVLNAMRSCGKLVVVRVQGKATGGGVGIACAADYCFATKQASVALPEINLEIGPFVIGSFVARKIGKAQFTAMSLDAEFRSADWALQHNIYNKIFENTEEMDAEISKFLEKLASKNIHVLSYLKQVSWEGTAYFPEVLPERIMMSASLLLEEPTKRNIHKIKESLGKK